MIFLWWCSWHHASSHGKMPTMFKVLEDYRPPPTQFSSPPFWSVMFGLHPSRDHCLCTMWTSSLHALSLQFLSFRQDSHCSLHWSCRETLAWQDLPNETFVFVLIPYPVLSKTGGWWSSRECVTRWYWSRRWSFHLSQSHSDIHIKKGNKKF